MNTFADLMDLEDSEYEEGATRPIWTINLKDKEAVLQWLVQEYKYLLNINRPRHEEMMENILIHKGDQFAPEDKKMIMEFYNLTNRNRSRTEKLIINHLHDLTETIVSRSTRNPPAPEVMPANSNELSDRNAARSAKQILDHISFINRLNMKDIRWVRQSKICGEAYSLNIFNEDLGDIHPLWLEAKQVDFKNEDGSPILGFDGKPLDPKKPLMTGEIENRIIYPWRILLQNKDEFDDVDYCFVIDIEDVDELKHDYKKSKEKIKSIEGDLFDSSILKTRKFRNETIKLTFFHKKTKYLPEGLEIHFTLDCLLDVMNFRYDHKKLPIARLTDIDIEGSLHAESFFILCKNLQWRHNQLTSDIITNQRLMSKPKWMVPKGKADIKALGNDRTVCQFAGRVAPSLVSMNPTPPEAFQMRRELKEDMEQSATVTGVSRRDPPSGLTASVSMKFMSELETERVSVSITKHNEFMREIYEQNLSIAGTFYDESDGRTMRVLGKDQEFELMSMETSNLSKPYDVIIRNIGTLGESRSIKEARIFDTLDRRPELLSDEELIDILEIGSIDKMTSLLTQSLRAAEAENEALLSGKPVPEPAPYEDHITHWRVHVHRLQSFNLKMSANPADLDALEEHLWMTEFLMYEKAKQNPTFEAQLATLKLFPVFYVDGQSFKPSSKAHQAAVVQGQANRGEDITGMIPADDIEETKAFDKQQSEPQEKE